MPPSAFLSWVQETTFAGVPLWSLLIAVLAGVATYLGILLALSLLTGRARAWASQSHSGVARAMVDVLEGTSRFLMLVAALLVGASFLDLPGRWENRLSQLWFVAVALQMGLWGMRAIGIALGGMVVLAFAAWLYDSTRHGSTTVRRGGAGVAALAAALAVLGGLSGIDAGAPATTLRDRNWEAYGAARLAELRRSGQPVFLNFTAAWCISCLINERVALSDAAVADAFRDAGVTYLKGDWTNRDQEITAKLAEFGRSGVPLYVFFPPGGSAAPVVLPQILTPQIVLDAVRTPALIATHHP